MAKKKKSARRNDNRGYGQSQQGQTSRPNNSNSKIATSTSKSNNKEDTVAISSKTHDGLVDLLGKLDTTSDAGETTNLIPSGSTSSSTTTTTRKGESIKSNRFVSKLASIVYRLEEYQFQVSPHIEQVVVALGYDITLESALDWLCLNLTTSELPPLFTEGKVREGLQEKGDSQLEFVIAPKGTSSSLQEDGNLHHDFNSQQKANLKTFHPNNPESSENKTGKVATTTTIFETKEEAESHKAWLLAMYEYDDDGDDGDHHDDIKDDNINQLENNQTLSGNNESNENARDANASPDDTTIERSVEEVRLEMLEKELQELEADYTNEANNYMRSKQEKKELGIEVKKLKQQVNGLRKKVEKQKASTNQLDRPNNSRDGTTASTTTSNPSVETNTPDSNDDESGGLFSMFFEEEPPSQATTTPNSTLADKEDLEVVSVVDYTISKDWTGTTPKKTLEEWCRKRKLPTPKFIKLPRNAGVKLVVVTESLPSKSSKQQQQNASAQLEIQHSKQQQFMGDPQEYLAIQALYKLEPRVPLYRLFPPAYRNLWLSWVQNVQNEKQQAKQELETAKQQYLDRLLSLIESSTMTSSTEVKATTKNTVEDDKEPVDKKVLDSWEDDDDQAMGKFSPTYPTVSVSIAGTKLRDDFMKRESSHSYVKMKKIRSTLPIFSFRQEILETIRNNSVTVLCAETGAGKTTQCPQYILEDALLHSHGDSVQIICTQPRRVAATSVAERVAEEFGDDKIGETIGYQIRMESKRSNRTKLLFCTTGVILRRLQDDSMLKGVTHVIVDEVHERQQQTDVLLVAVRRLLNTGRPDLKVILMSATLDSKLFCNFFQGAPLISVPGRTFPVSSYFLEDLIEATDHVIEEGSRYALREDRRQGDKASLWVTTRGGEKRKEVVDLESQVDVSEISDLYPGYKFTTRRSMDRVNEEIINYDLIEDILNLILTRPEANESLLAPEGANLSKGSVLVFLPGLGEIRSLSERLEGSRTLGNKGHFEIIPLHSSLSSKDQRKAFIPSKAGCRKIILSTNIAETSVTIPDVVCVIDSGRLREVRQNKKTSIPTLVTDWCSKASVKQRSGRAGRVQPGLCLKLYSSRTAKLVMKCNSEPELRRVPLEEVCLSILASGFAKSCRDFLSQAPQPPSEESVQAAISVLLEVGAITVDADSDGSSKTPFKTMAHGTETLTPLGHHLSKLPVDVRLGKMLIFGALFNCIDRVLTVAAALSSQSLFATFMTDAQVAKAKQKAFYDPESDFMTICNVWEAYNVAAASSGDSGGRKFCHSNYLNYVALREIRDARWQFLDLLCGIGFLEREAVTNIGHGGSGKNKRWDDDALKASSFNENGDKVDVFHAVVCAGLYPNVARLVKSPSGGPDQATLWQNKQRLYFHSSSVHSSKNLQRHKSSDKWVAFHEKFATPHRVSVSTVCFIHPLALLLFGGSVVVKHVDRKVVVDDWIEIGMAAQTGVMMRELRHRVDGLLNEMIQNDSRQAMNFRSEEQRQTIGRAVVSGIVKLLDR